MSEQKIPVIIDCDPGIDDTMALAVAFAQPNLEVLAVCSVAGNVGIERTTANARAVVATLGVDCPVYRGAESALMPGKAVVAPEAHGVSGLGNFTMDPALFAPLQAEHAVNAQRRLLMDSAKPVTIIAVGPLTNIALLLRMYPEVQPRIKCISLMGGGLNHGNHTAAAEFNILADPEAAEIVFRSGVPLIMAGLDVTEKARLGYAEYQQFGAIGGPVGRMVYDALTFSFSRGPKENHHNLKSTMHDAVSVLAVAQPDMVAGNDLHVVVETAGVYSRGYTLADTRDAAIFGDRLPQPNCHVLFDIDGQRFMDELVRCVKSYA